LAGTRWVAIVSKVRLQNAADIYDVLEGFQQPMQV